MTSLSTTHTGGRAGARRLLVAAAVSVCVALPGAHLAATVDPAPAPEVIVREARGTYSVTARFEVPQPPAVALAVLSDYEQIPRFMPGVRTSVVRERTPGRVVVEQEAVSQFMLFSKQVHLLLDVTEEEGVIRFVDRSGRSFRRYEGAWQAIRQDGGTTITYELAARPAFDVPEFILKRLLKRDSGQMINCLRREIAARAAR
ncbi:MAG TPA: SRPBCC family protein [Vicinamibacterales bacterium]|nr:SRPBCC family protein [Vicinamibacterales bacterium]